MKRITILTIALVILASIGVSAIQDCTFGYCNPTPPGGCALPSYYWACINNTALCYDPDSHQWGYDCWAVDSCQEAYCYIQGTGSPAASSARSDHQQQKK